MTKTKKRQGHRRLKLEVRYWRSYEKEITALERAIHKKPRTIRIEIAGTGVLRADAALRLRAALLKRSPTTRIVTHANSSLEDGSVLLWLLGDSRSIREDARLFFRRTPVKEEHVVQDNEAPGSIEEEYHDSDSEIDADEGDYARVLELINEFLPVKEMAGRLINVPVLRQFGLIENEKVDSFLATVFAKEPVPEERSMEKSGASIIAQNRTSRARQLKN